MTQELIDQAKSLASKINATITHIHGLQAVQESTTRQQAADQVELDAAVASGDFSDEKAIATTANRQAKLLLYPAKFSQIKAEIISRDWALYDYLDGAYVILVKAEAETREDLFGKIKNVLATFISVDHRVEALAQQAVEYCDKLVAAKNASKGFSPLDVQQYRASSDDIEPTAKHAAEILDKVGA